LVTVLKHMTENGITLAKRSVPAFAHALLAVLLLIPISAGAMMRGPYGLDALARGAGPLSLTRVDYQVAGAAQGGTDVRVVSFDVKWQSDSAAMGAN